VLLVVSDLVEAGDLQGRMHVRDVMECAVRCGVRL
jgi:hypothetical protein